MNFRVEMTMSFDSAIHFAVKSANHQLRTDGALCLTKGGYAVVRTCERLPMLKARESRSDLAEICESTFRVEGRGTDARFPDSNPVIRLRFLCRLGIPTLAVFAGQIFVGIRQVCDLLGRAVVEQFLSRPQCDRIQVHGL